MLRTVRATRYVTPLREGGSLPAIVEGEDLGLYVLKFRGAGQGPLALVAELVAGEIGRVLGLKVPEIVFVDIDTALGRNEPDEEIRDLLRASTGINLALDYLPGSVMFDPAAGDTAESQVASRAVWFDSLVTNVDRTAHNPNLLYWHKSLYFIDHGAALYFHHDWANSARSAATRFPLVRKHVLLPWAAGIAEANEELGSMLSEPVFSGIVRMIPDEWLLPAAGVETPDEQRAAYTDWFLRRLAAAADFTEEAIRARSELI
ncbi:MAG: aminotransferase class I and II [Bryobacteraceae bacterium]|nr:aminotransferase class I and II [Bryobacteraceae bacterium]